MKLRKTQYLDLYFKKYEDEILNIEIQQANLLHMCTTTENSTLLTRSFD